MVTRRGYYQGCFAYVSGHCGCGPCYQAPVPTHFPPPAAHPPPHNPGPFFHLTSSGGFKSSKSIGSAGVGHSSAPASGLHSCSCFTTPWPTCKALPASTNASPSSHSSKQTPTTCRSSHCHDKWLIDQPSSLSTNPTFQHHRWRRGFHHRRIHPFPRWQSHHGLKPRFRHGGPLSILLIYCTGPPRCRRFDGRWQARVISDGDQKGSGSPTFHRSGH